MSVRKLHNNLVSDTDNGGLKEARNAYNNIIISDSTLCSLSPPQLEKCRQDTRSCVVANVAYMPKVYIPHYCHGVIVFFLNSRIKYKIPKTKGLGEN